MIRRVTHLCTLLGLVFWIATPSSGADLAPPATEPPANYARPCQPQVKPAFLPLPLGSVEPAGWLRDWAVAAREGITGHLDEYHSVFHDGWKGPRVSGHGLGPDGTGWPLEQCAYWLDGALRLGFVLHDEALIKKIRARLDPIVDGVNKADFGTSFIYWKKGYKPEGFNSWAHSQMGRALVALYQGTGDKRVLDALVKVYADYPAKMGQMPTSTHVSGLCNLDAMLETYSLSGDRRILDRALAAMAQPEVAHDIRDLGPRAALPPATWSSLYENIRLPALVYPWSGDRRAACRPRLGAFRWLDDEPHAPLRRGLRRGIRLGHRRLPQDRNLRRDGHAAGHLVDVPHPGRRRLGRPHGAGLLQCRRPPPSPATSRPCATTSRPTASDGRFAALRAAASPGPDGLPLPPARLPHGPVLRRRRQPHHPQLHHAHVDGHRRQRAGRHALRPLHGLRLGGTAGADAA